MIILTQFKKYFNDKLILDIPHFTFNEGIHWIKGQNGSGKTTLLRCMAGILPFSGSITLEGTPLTPSGKTYRSMVNYAEAEPRYPGFLTGLEMIGFYEKVNNEDPAVTKDLIKYFGMDAFIQDKLFSYSSGMLKKLSLVLTFIGQAKCLLLDEPLITLDQEAQSGLVKLIEKKRSGGVSFIISTHQDWPKELEHDYIHTLLNRNISTNNE